MNEKYSSLEDNITAGYNATYFINYVIKILIHTAKGHDQNNAVNQPARK